MFHVKQSLMVSTIIDCFTWNIPVTAHRPQISRPFPRQCVLSQPILYNNHPHLPNQGGKSPPPTGRERDNYCGLTWTHLIIYKGTRNLIFFFFGLPTPISFF